MFSFDKLFSYRGPHSDSPFRQGSSRRQGRPPRSDTWASPQVSQVEPVRPEGELWRIRAQAGLSVVAILAVVISEEVIPLMQNEKYLTIDVGGTSIKYTITDRNAKITKISK